MIGCALRPDRGVRPAQAKMVETGPQRANALEQQLAALQFDDRGHRRAPEQRAVRLEATDPLARPDRRGAGGDGADPKLCSTTSSSRRSDAKNRPAPRSSPTSPNTPAVPLTRSPPSSLAAEKMSLRPATR